jgi:hypothetical protein
MSGTIGPTRARAARLLAVAAACAACLHARDARGQDEIQELVRRSQFIFRGTIRQLGSATLPEVRVGDDTAVVTVDEVLLAPPKLGDYTGKNITVQLRSGVGDERKFVFFTTSWLYGSGLAVREVGRLGQTQAAGIEQRLAAAQQRLADDHLKSRLDAAELVVVGRVTAVRTLNQGRRPHSEHDPLWRSATVSVGSVEKGTASGPTATVFFPGSTDVVWYRSPKFKVGQEGVFILDRDAGKEYRLDGFTALEPLDFQPKTQLDRVRRLIGVRP